MTPPIERIRYYDGEYLRAFDFSDEQTYHLEMRRRLNMALHLSGIVEGLGITLDVEAGIKQFSIDPGMAIDPFGREILVFSSYVLDETVLAANRQITGPGDYDLWIRYRKTPATPPGAGYANCNMSDEFTRWQEGFSVAIVPQSGTGNSTDLPAPTDPQSDDPTTDSLGVQLGVVSVTSTPSGVAIDAIALTNRTFIGLRAQRVVCPVDPTDFKVLEKHGTLGPASLELQSNVTVDKNLIVGDDFKVDTSKFPQAPPATFPSPTGNVKVTGDLFINGNLYTSSGDLWLTVKQQIASALPDFQFWTQVFSPLPTGTDPSTGTVQATLTSKLKSVTAVSAQAMLCGIEWLDPATLKTWFNAAGPNSMPVLLTAGAAVAAAPGSSTYNIPINWTVGPVATLGVSPNTTRQLGIKSMSVGLLVVFLP